MKKHNKKIILLLFIIGGVLLFTDLSRLGMVLMLLTILYLSWQDAKKDNLQSIEDIQRIENDWENKIYEI